MDIEDKYKFTEDDLHLNIRLGFGDSFDHSYGHLFGGGFFCWKNRYGGKTFVNSSEDEEVNRCIVCGNGWEIISISTLVDFPGFEYAESEYEEDGCPDFCVPSPCDLERLVYELCTQKVGHNKISEEHGLYLSDRSPSQEEESRLIRDYEIQSALTPELIKMPYQKFLASAYWEIVKRVMRRHHEGRCQICGATKKLDVHHKTYRHHGLELQFLDDLMLVCRDCHQKIHNMDK